MAFYEFVSDNFPPVLKVVVTNVKCELIWIEFKQKHGVLWSEFYFAHDQEKLILSSSHCLYSFFVCLKVLNRQNTKIVMKTWYLLVLEIHGNAHSNNSQPQENYVMIEWLVFDANFSNISAILWRLSWKTNQIKAIFEFDKKPFCDLKTKSYLFI